MSNGVLFVFGQTIGTGQTISQSTADSIGLNCTCTSSTWVKTNLCRFIIPSFSLIIMLLYKSMIYSNKKYFIDKTFIYIFLTIQK